MKKPSEEDFSDDEIELELDKFQKAGIFTTAVFDCCYSGSVWRAEKDRNSRSVRRPLLSDTTFREKIIEPKMSRVFIGATSEDDDVEEHNSDDGKTYGYLTYHLNKILQQEEGDVRVERVLNKLDVFYKNEFTNIHPEIEGPLDRKIFGTKALGVPLHAKVINVFPSKKAFVLNRGFLSGIRKGSIFCLIEGVDDINKTPLPSNKLVVIDRVSPFESEAIVLSKEREKNLQQVLQEYSFQNTLSSRGIRGVRGWHAVELIHRFSEDFCLKVYLEKQELIQKKRKKRISSKPAETKDFGALQTILETLQISDPANKIFPVITKVNKKRKADVVIRRGQFTAAIDWRGERYFYNNSDLEGGFEPKGFNKIPLDDAEGKKLKKLLVRFHKINSLKKLSNQFLKKYQGNLECKASLVKTVETENDSKVYKAGEVITDRLNFVPILHHGDKIGVNFTNNSDSSVYAYIIHVSCSLGIAVIPTRKSKIAEIPPKKTLFLGGVRLNSEGDSKNPNGKYGRETFIILASTVYQDYYKLEENSLVKTRAEKDEKSSLGDLIFQASFVEKRKFRGGNNTLDIGQIPLRGDNKKWKMLSFSWIKAGHFSISQIDKKNLKEGKVHLGLRKKFHFYRMFLGKNAKVIKDGNHWKIIDHRKYNVKQFVLKRNGQRSYRMIISEHKKSYSLIGNRDFSKALDQGKIPDVLREKFQKSGLTLTLSARVKRKKNSWLVEDDCEYTIKSIGETMYVLKTK